MCSRITLEHVSIWCTCLDPPHIQMRCLYVKRNPITPTYLKTIHLALTKVPKYIYSAWVAFLNNYSSLKSNTLNYTNFCLLFLDVLFWTMFVGEHSTSCVLMKPTTPYISLSVAPNIRHRRTWKGGGGLKDLLL